MDTPLTYNVYGGNNKLEARGRQGANPLSLGREEIGMSRLRVFSIRRVRNSALLCLALVLATGPTIGQTEESNCILVLASGFLCDPGDSSACPAVAKASAGDSYEVSGAGTFNAQSKSVMAAGTYTHKSSNGNVVETGVWVATELVSFDSYGAAPNALPRQGVGPGPGVMGLKRMPMNNRGLMPTGGLATFRILLMSITGQSTRAVLQVNCALGDVAHERSVEGIRLTLERSHSEYSEEIRGRVMFLAMKPGMSTPVKARQEEMAPESSEPPQN